MKFNNSDIVNIINAIQGILTLDRNFSILSDVEIEVGYLQDMDGDVMGRFTRTSGLAEEEKVLVTISRSMAPGNVIYVMAQHHDGQNGKFVDEQFSFHRLLDAAKYVGDHLTTAWWVPDKEGE